MEMTVCETPKIHPTLQRLTVQISLRFPLISGKADRMWPLYQGWTNFPKIYEQPQKCRRQKDDMKHVPYWGPADIRRHLTKFANLRPGFARTCIIYFHSQNIKSLLEIFSSLEKTFLHIVLSYNIRYIYGTILRGYSTLYHMTSHLILESAFTHECCNECDVLFIYLLLIILLRYQSYLRLHGVELHGNTLNRKWRTLPSSYDLSKFFLCNFRFTGIFKK